MNSEDIKETEVVEEVNQESTEVVDEKVEDQQCECSEDDKSCKKDKKKKLFEKKDPCEELRLKNVELEAEVVKLKNEYLKAYADTENTRKRLQTDFESRQKYRIQSFALEVLPVIDNLERALAVKSTDENDTFYKGVEMTYNQLIYALKNEGVEEVESLGKPFDHNFHQAIVSEVCEGVEPNHVVEVFQKGFKLKDRILRAAMVKVSE